jgi:hypothetical protein
MTDHIQLGRDAELLLKNETFVRAMDEVAEDIFAQFLSSTDRDRKEQLWATGQVLMVIKHKLDSYVDNGKLRSKGYE